MQYRTAAVSALFAAILTGCSTTDNRNADDNPKYASAGAVRNATCPVCGMPADASCSVSLDGKTADCCSRACCDRFNGSSAIERQRMMDDACGQRTSSRNSSTYGTIPGNGAEVNTVAQATEHTKHSRTRSNTADAKGGNAYAESSMRMENDYSPISGKAASQNYVVDEDGHRIGFATQQEADLYRSYGPEHRAELRSHLK